ncbi:MAG: 16S rRNA (guanine(966)-N(2))-methyltransferase RsmD [Omnitrophica WOR_2 bacterium RIFCSPLOWO2_12_FULL_51_8]|nr:MAG: 16S rRNA (guanine(966)-N(2))-methyltransferase RsmD [Omnitrophica WOR_2 bacterium RIFCSPLOWO2_12_FULL_51_8]
MRIITGKYKGRVIKMPKGIRPTQDKVRKALFDILGDISEMSFLELFAGSGAIGIEALSRGAKEAEFVEEKRDCARQIAANLAFIKAGGRRITQSDAQEAIKKLSREGKRFEIIFLDPPYCKGPVAGAVEPLVKKTLRTLSSYDILAPCGLAIAQHFKKDLLPDTLGDLILFRQSRYGDTVLSFYRKCAR